MTLTYLEFYALAGAQHFALQVEGAALFGIVHVEEALEALVDLGEVGFAGFRGGDVEDLACFVEGEAGAGYGGGGGAVALVCGGEFLGILLGWMIRKML